MGGNINIHGLQRMRLTDFGDHLIFLFLAFLLLVKCFVYSLDYHEIDHRFLVSGG